MPLVKKYLMPSRDVNIRSRMCFFLILLLLLTLFGQDFIVIAITFYPLHGREREISASLSLKF